MYEHRLDIEIAQKCVELFKSEQLYYLMKDIKKHYPISTKVNLNKTVFNRLPWVGQATCNLHLRATIQETTYAWMKLKYREQKRANDIATTIIEEYHNATLFDL